MGISELIASIGDENIMFQNLQQSSPHYQKSGNEARVTFSTSQECALESILTGKKVCLILFFDRDKYIAKDG